MRIVLLGAPGSGKGTQAALLSEKLGVPHISTGDLLRAQVDKGTQLGLRAKQVMDRGELVSDEIVLGMLRDRLGEDDCCDGFILDGFPRNLVQAEALDHLLVEIDAPLESVVWIDVDPEHIVQRIALRAVTEGRADDSADTVRRRLQVYANETAPVIGYYGERSALTKIDGVGEIEQVFDRICQQLPKRGECAA